MPGGIDVRSRRAATLAGVVVGVTAFLYVFPLQVLDPTRLGYVMGSGDLASYHVSATYFAQTPVLQFPLGANPDNAGEWCSSIFATESFFALVQKLVVKSTASLLRVDLPIGLNLYPWYFLISTCALSVILMRIIAKSRQLLASSCLCLSVLLSPLFLSRHLAYHETVFAVWPLALALYFYLERATPVTRFLQSLLIVVTTLVFPYQVPMTSVVLLSQVQRRLSTGVSLRQRIRRLTFDVTQHIAVCLGTVMAVSGWSVLSNSEREGLGMFHANLLSIIDPNQTSRFLGDLATLNQGFDYEGFAYPGVGFLLLATLLVVARIRSTWIVVSTHAFLMAGLLLMSVLSTGGVLAIGDHLILDVSSQVSPLATFRSSGRFLSYTIFISLALTCRALSSQKSKYVLVASILLLTIQIAETFSLASALRNRENAEVEVDPIVERSLESANEVVFVVPDGNAWDWKMKVLNATSTRNIKANDTFCGRYSFSKLKVEQNVARQRFESLDASDSKAPLFLLPYGVNLDSFQERAANIIQADRYANERGLRFVVVSKSHQNP